MTKDLAMLVGANQQHLTTDAFMDAIDQELKRRMATN
jgi:isocitrate dehydrogenase